MDDATINPVGAYDPVSRLPDGGGRGKQGPTGRKPSTRRAMPPASPAPAADPGPADPPDPDTPRGRRIDDRA